MKKSLFFATLLGLAVVATSCKPKEPTDPTSDLTGITINPSELTLSEGESFKLTAKVQPEGVAATIVWESSDTLVAIVDSRGNVTAQYSGEAVITASAGEVKAECKVSVKSFLETIQFTKALLYSEDTAYYADPTTGVIPVDTIKASDGSEYLAYRAMGELWLFSEGFFINNEGYFDGADQAAITTVYAPFYYATAYLNKAERGTVFTLGDWIVTSVDSLAGRSHVGTPGQVDEAAYKANIQNFWGYYFNNDTETAVSYMKAASDNFSGALLKTWTYDAEGGGYSYSYIPDALVKKGQFSLDVDPVYNYMCALEYSRLSADLIGGTWGLGYEIDIDTVASTWSMGDNLVFEKTIEYSFGELPAAGAPKFEPLNAVILKEDAPEVAARLEAIKNNQVRFIKK